MAGGAAALAIAAGAVSGWLRSGPHRRVLLDPWTRDIGVGFARGAPLVAEGASRGATVVLDVGAR